LLEQNTIIQSVDTFKDPPGRPSFIDSFTINLWNDYTTLCGSCIVAIKTIGNKLRLLFAKSDTEQFALIKQAISYINNTPTWHTKSDVKKRYKPVGFQPFGTFNADATKQRFSSRYLGPTEGEFLTYYFTSLSLFYPSYRFLKAIPA
jgi:hypothetical protein